MDAKLNQQTVTYLKSVLDTTGSHEESRETIVPDSLPDISRIICASGSVMLRGKEAEEGRVTVSGDITIAAAYSADGQQGLKKLQTDMQFSHTVTAPEVSSGSKIWAEARIESVDVRALNPRKVLARACLVISVRCYDGGEINMACRGEEDGGIQYLERESEAVLPWALEEKTFIVSDDLTFPGGRGAVEIIGGTAILKQGEVKTVGSKLIFKGDALMQIKYITADGELGDMRYASGFSQIMELEDAGGCCDFEMGLMLTGCYFEPDVGADGTISGVTAEIHAVAQVTAYKSFTLNYIADAYDTDRTLKLESTDSEFTSFGGMEQREELFREKLDCHGNPRDVVSLDVSAGNVTTGPEGKIRIPMNVSAVFVTEEGGIASASGRFEFTADWAGEGSSCTGVMIDDSAYGSPSDGGIDLRIPVFITFRRLKKLVVGAVTGISWDEEEEAEQKEMPSLIVRRTRQGDSVWEMAKCCGSTRELILEANGLESEEIGENMLLLIPRRRK